MYRRHEDAFGLWQGSDVDLEERFEEALEHIGRTEPARRLERSVSLRPIVARAHYIEKGTLRYFDVRLIEGTEEALEERASQTIEADGEIVYVISRSDKRQRLIKKALELTASNSGKEELRIFAFPRPLLGLEEALQEVEGWRWVGENEQALQGDPVARSELQARLKAANWRLEEVAGSILGLRGHRFDPTASEWVRSGRTHELGSARGFARWISELCDAVYYKTPTLRNELVNRGRLSSAAAKARRNLLEGMLEREDEYRLGFEGTPAEVSVYESLLRAGGFHKETEDGWALSTPGEDWQPIWEAMNDFLSTTEGSRKPLNELFSALKRPPYGLRDGPLPILLCAYVLGRNEEVALYEEGVFVPEPYIELFERLLRSPEKFEIRQFTLPERGRDALAATKVVVEALIVQPGTSTSEQSHSVDEPGLLEVVKPLVVAAAQLPAYARRTRRVEPPEAVPLRNVLLRARDPYDLIFSDIPDALGLSLDSDEDVARLPDLLRECLLGLQRAYPMLLDELEEHIREALGLYGTTEEALQQLKARAEPLVEYAGSQTTGLFVRESANINDLNSKNWRETLGRVLNNGTPPYEWRDRDLVGFQVRLREVSSDFIRLEEMVAEKQQAGADTRIFRVGVLDGRLAEARGLISLPPDRYASTEELADKIVQTIGSSEGDGDRREHLAALALVAMEYLEAEGSTDGE